MASVAMRVEMKVKTRWLCLAVQQLRKHCEDRRALGGLTHEIDIMSEGAATRGDMRGINLRSLRASRRAVVPSRLVALVHQTLALAPLNETKGAVLTISCGHC